MHLFWRITSRWDPGHRIPPPPHLSRAPGLEDRFDMEACRFCRCAFYLQHRLEGRAKGLAAEGDPRGYTLIRTHSAVPATAIFSIFPLSLPNSPHPPWVSQWCVTLPIPHEEENVRDHIIIGLVPYPSLLVTLRFYFYPEDVKDHERRCVQRTNEEPTEEARVPLMRFHCFACGNKFTTGWKAKRIGTHILATLLTVTRVLG